MTNTHEGSSLLCTVGRVEFILWSSLLLLLLHRISLVFYKDRSGTRIEDGLETVKPAEGLLQCARRRGVSVWAENVEPDVHESKEKRGLDEEASEDDSQSLETSWIWTWRGAGRQSAFSSPKSFLKYLLIYLAVLGLSCSTQGLQLQYVGLNSLASDRTWAPALGAKSLSTEPPGKSLRSFCLSRNSVSLAISGHVTGAQLKFSLFLF